MLTVMITGAGRGIGLELTRQYDGEGWRVLACCRTPAAAAELDRLARASGGGIAVHTLDVDSGRSVAALKAEVGDLALDVVINNAGISGQSKAARGNIDYDAWAGAMNTNVMGPMRVAEAFAPNLAAGEQKKLITVSSMMGSIGLNRAPDGIVYRSSKAAVNMVMSCLANDLGGQGVICHSFHPGWVRTDMGGPQAAVSVEDSAAGMRAVIAALSTADNGGFSNYDGAKLAW